MLAIQSGWNRKNTKKAFIKCCVGLRLSKEQASFDDLLWMMRCWVEYNMVYMGQGSCLWQLLTEAIRPIGLGRILWYENVICLAAQTGHHGQITGVAFQWQGDAKRVHNTSVQGIGMILLAKHAPGRNFDSLIEGFYTKYLQISDIRRSAQINEG